MKKLLFPCLLVISLMNTVTIKELVMPTIEYAVVAEEADEAFDFDTTAYLPIGFDPYISFEEKYGLEYEVILEEEDAPFEFDTASYLPVGFELNSTILDSIEEIIVEEEEENFDFNTQLYLPKDFNATKTVVVKTEI